MTWQSDISSSAGGWRPDVLGAEFEQRTLEIPAAVGAPTEATLVRHVPSAVAEAPRRVAVLYVHGFCDYFFQANEAQALAASGTAFYAVDLRGYGRSMAAWVARGGDPNMVSPISQFAQDLDAAAAAVREAGHERLVVLGHSMGGLVTTLWVQGRSGRADALVLNSPWFDLNESWLLREPVTELVKLVAPIAPRLKVGGLKPYYHEALAREWNFNQEWKPVTGFPVEAAFFASVRRAQSLLNAGVETGVPTLVLASDRTGSHTTDHADLLTTDSVLDVGQIRRGAERIGRDVDFHSVPGGAHDLALSPVPAREVYFDTVTDWIAERV